MATLTMARRTGEYILSEANGTRSREKIVIATGSGVLHAGTVLAAITAANAATATAAGGNDSTASFGTITVSNVADTGTYALVVTSAKDGATPAAFTVTAPDGSTANGSAGVAFNALGLSFTLTDGLTTGAVAANDAWTIAVQAGIGQYVPYDDDGTNDGRRTASAILYAGVDATLTDVEAVAHVRDCEVAGNLLTGIDAAGITELASAGVIVR
jgi:hypothetical protein